MSLHLIPQSNSIDSRCMFEVAADMLFTMIRESAALSTTPPAHALADCWILQPARNVPVATWVQEVDRCVKFCTGLPPPTGIGAQPRNSRAKDVSVGPITNQTTPTRGCGWLTVRLLRTLLDRGGSQRGWLDRHLGGGKARVVLVRRRHLCSRLLSTETSVWLTEPMPSISCGLSRLAPGDLGRS